MLHLLKNIKYIFLAVFLIKLRVLIIILASQLFFTQNKNAVYRFIKPILEEYYYHKNVIKRCFDKNLVMSAKDEKRFQSSNKCWICDELFDVGDSKERDHCPITGKYRGSAHWSCNINLKLTKKVPVICHSLRGYGSRLIIRKIGKFDAKVNVIPIGLENTWLLQLTIT